MTTGSRIPATTTLFLQTLKSAGRPKPYPSGIALLQRDISSISVATRIPRGSITSKPALRASMNIPAGVKLCILNYCRRTAVNPVGSRLKDLKNREKRYCRQGVITGKVCCGLQLLAPIMDDIRGMGLKPRDPDGAGRSLSCASSRLLQYLSANLLPACGPGVYGWCCIFPPVRGAVHDRRSFPGYGCSSLSWYFLPDYFQGKNQFFLMLV
jgi:hypothetical protein